MKMNHNWFLSKRDCQTGRVWAVQSVPIYKNFYLGVSPQLNIKNIETVSIFTRMELQIIDYCTSSLDIAATIREDDFIISPIWHFLPYCPCLGHPRYHRAYLGTEDQVNNDKLS